MRKNKAARKAATNRAKVCKSKHDQIIADYERGTWWAGWVLVAMFAFLSLGSVMFGW